MGKREFLLPIFIRDNRMIPTTVGLPLQGPSEKSNNEKSPVPSLVDRRSSIVEIRRNGQRGDELSSVRPTTDLLRQSSLLADRLIPLKMTPMIVVMHQTLVGRRYFLHPASYDVPLLDTSVSRLGDCY
jgi:hypothetical protein